MIARMMSLIDAVRQPRTANEIAARIGFTPQAVRNWLAGRFAPSAIAQRALQAAGIVLPPRPARARRGRRRR
jgi:predicted transcriptional regulator